MSDRKDVVTIYCCGTGGHRGKHAKWAVPYLYSITKGQRAFVCDGPGGAKIPRAEDVVKAVEAGGDVKDKLFRKTRGANLMSQATGRGTADNIVLCLQWLWLQWHSERFVDINLIGWSRGAVTCIMLAHSIQEAGFSRLSGDLRVNIFTFDPVPGGKNDFAVTGTFDETGRAGTPDELAPCVASYASVLHETIKKWLKKPFIKKDKNFACVIPHYTGHNAHRTQMQLYAMPGGHGESGKYNDAEGGGPLGKIGLHLAQEFLMAHGTAFTASHVCSPAQLVELYAQVRVKYSKGDDLAKQAPSPYRRDVISNAFRADPFYVNSHHAGLIEQHYPALAAHLAGNGSMDVKSRALLGVTAPHTYAALRNLGLLN